jgi:hypothetical protein
LIGADSESIARHHRSGLAKMRPAGCILIATRRMQTAQLDRWRLRTITVGHLVERSVSCVPCGLSGGPPRNAWCRTIGHTEDIFPLYYSTRRYCPCCVENSPSGRIL